MTLATLIGHVTPLATSFFLPLVSLFGASATFANSVTSSHLSIWQNIVPSYLPPCTPIPLHTTSNLDKKIFSKTKFRGRSIRKKNSQTLKPRFPQIWDCLHFAIILFENSSETTIPILAVFLFIWPFKLRDRKLKAWHRKGWSSRHVHKFLGIIRVCLVRLKYAHKCLEILLVCLDLSRHAQRWLEILKHLWVHPSISAMAGCFKDVRC